jgi:hypothetical protein
LRARRKLPPELRSMSSSAASSKVLEPSRTAVSSALIHARRSGSASGSRWAESVMRF